MNITASMVKDLRSEMGAGVLDCRNALVAAEGDFEKAKEILREQGMAQAEKRKERETHEGVISAYVHIGDRIGAMVEVNCETDFVARTDEFQDLARELTLQVAATKPLYVSREDVPQDVIEVQRVAFLAEAQDADKPAHILDRIVSGKMEKFYQESCLLEQTYIRDPDITVRELIDRSNATLGENVVVRRFVRYELGQ